MIIWIASYPRSGNTLLRIMLKEVFGCNTYARNDRVPNPAEWKRVIQDATGVVHVQGTWSEKYPRLAESKDLCFVKTHNVPEDNSKAVYVARNGMASIISYQCYLRDLRRKDYSLDDIILGKPRFGSWGYHLDMWQPLDRPNTLLLKYEDLVENPDEQIAKLTEFCGLQPQKKWVNEFDKLHAANPRFFRKGQTGDASAEFSDSERDLFWALHGDWMQRLGYAKDFDCAKALPQLRKALMHYAQSLPAEKPATKAQTEERPGLRRALAGIFNFKAKASP